MIASVQQFVGKGLYSVAEAALYARVSVRMMRRWLYAATGGNAVFTPEFGEKEEAVSFHDFVQALAIREIRMQRKVSLGKFRQAIQVAKNSLGIEYPFARKHCTYLMAKDLVIKSAADQEFVKASGKGRTQKLFTFVEMYLEDLTFDTQGLASLYNIYRSPDGVVITMNPHIRFGEPVLPSGYTPKCIWEAVKTEGGIAEAASAYGISEEEVKASYSFFVSHLGKTAA